MAPMAADAPHRFDHVRVSELLAASDRALPLLIRHGFAPLRSPAMRAALAPTVTLAQAFVLRGLPEERADELRHELAALLEGERACT